MSWNRREVLAGLGVASAQALLWGCGGSAKPTKTAAPVEDSGKVRSWLYEAVATLRARYPYAHALAVSRRRTTAALDVLGAGIARGRCDGVVLTVRDGAMHREQVTSDLSRDGVRRAVAAMVDKATKPLRIDFGRMDVAPVKLAPAGDPRLVLDATLYAMVRVLAERDQALTSRIVYASSMIDVDDATVWSVSEGADREQRLVRVRKALTRVAWNGTRPMITEVEQGYAGGLGDRDLTKEQIADVTRSALVLMTPTAFEAGVQTVLLDPDVVVSILDATSRALLTGSAARRPEVAKRAVAGANLAAALLTLEDDPTAAGAYGGFYFDDRGEPARKVTLLDGGKLAGVLDDKRGRALRPGHIGAIDAAPSHLRLAPGNFSTATLLEDGFVLQGAVSTLVDPANDRIVVAVQRATEKRADKLTGRVYSDVELVGELSKLLAAVTAISSTTQTVSIRDDIGGQPRWRSIEAPSLRLTGMLRARRSQS